MNLAGNVVFLNKNPDRSYYKNKRTWKKE